MKIDKKFMLIIVALILLISAKNSRTNEEQYIEDNLQMQFLKNYKKRQVKS